MTDTAAARLDAFVDAAFAFAATVLLLGNNDLPTTVAEMDRALSALPSFLISFATMTMFWYTHVRWRRIRPDCDGLGTLLSLLLVFLVLVYVIPLRLFAGVTAAFFGLGSASPLRLGELGRVFVTYGLGFAAMAATSAALFATALKGPEREQAHADLGVQLILAAAGAASLTLASFPPTVPFAAWVYALIGPAIGLLSWRLARVPAPLPSAAAAE